MQQQAGGNARSMAAKDPLLKKAHAKMINNQFNKENPATPPAQRVMQLAALTFIPFAVYVHILFVTTYFFYASPAGVTLTFCVTGLLCVMQFLLAEHCTRKAAKRWKKWIGAFGALAAFMGLLVGVSIHYRWMLYNAKYTNMMKYSNVAASQPALQFEDAGSLLFTEGTTVDKTRAVGFRDIRTSQTLCVAPVVDQQMGPTDPIVFFAVGVNCCGWRGSFYCDDGAVSGTRGGLLKLKPDQLVSPLMEPMVADEFDFEGFENAIDLQKSVFALSAAKHHRMLRWVKDPIASVDTYRKRGLEAALISCLAFILVAAGLSTWDVAAENQRQKQRAREFMQGGRV